MKEKTLRHLKKEQPSKDSAKDNALLKRMLNGYQVFNILSVFPSTRIEVNENLDISEQSFDF